MARKTVEELEKEQLAALTKATDEAHAVKQTTLQKNIDTYNQGVDASVEKQKGVYEGRIRDAERVEKAQYDDNYIDELVARKNLENSMADMGLTDSGLNRGQQTAISVMRGNADARARQTAVNSVSALKDAIDQAIITGDQKKTAYQQEQSDKLSEWYQNQVLANKQSARSTAVEQYNAETEAIEKQQEAIQKQQESMLKNGYVQDKSGNWVKDDTAERTTYAMTLIKSGVPEGEAWASAYSHYPDDSDESLKNSYIKQLLDQGYDYNEAASLASAAIDARDKWTEDTGVDMQTHINNTVNELHENIIMDKANKVVYNLNFDWTVRKGGAGTNNDGKRTYEDIEKQLKANDTYNKLREEEKAAVLAISIATAVHKTWSKKEEDDVDAEKANNYTRLKEAAEKADLGKDFVSMVMHAYDSIIENGTSRETGYGRYYDENYGMVTLVATTGKIKKAAANI